MEVAVRRREEWQELKDEHVYLDIFPLCFVVQHVCDVPGEDLLSPRTSVDAHHRDANRPRRVAYRHL